jgi:HEAT repeat-containing protein 5
VRSLLLLPSPTPVDQSIARYLLPRLVAFVANTDPEDPENARKLISHTLTQYVGAVGSDHAQIVMAVVVPALLSRASSEGTEVYRETSVRLLEMASADQAAFRGIVAAMSEGQKAFMEEVIRSGRAPVDGGKGAATASGQPSIALKMDFGS